MYIKAWHRFNTRLKAKLCLTVCTGTFKFLRLGTHLKADSCTKCTRVHSPPSSFYVISTGSDQKLAQKKTVETKNKSFEKLLR